MGEVASRVGVMGGSPTYAAFQNHIIAIVGHVAARCGSSPTDICRCRSGYRRFGQRQRGETFHLTPMVEIGVPNFEAVVVLCFGRKTSNLNMEILVGSGRGITIGSGIAHVGMSAHIHY